MLLMVGTLWAAGRAAQVPSGGADPILRVSDNAEGTQANRSAARAYIAPDGRWVVFHSVATNMVPRDTNNVIQIYLRDMESGALELVSVSEAGEVGNANSYNSAFSRDGRVLLFDSPSSNLVPTDSGTWSDVYLRDMVSGTITLISRNITGTHPAGDSYGPALSDDGRVVAYVSRAPFIVPEDRNTLSLEDVFVYDREEGATERVSVATDGTPANSIAHQPSLSDDGRFVVFASLASNLVPNDNHMCPGSWGPNQNCWDIFLHDRQTGETRRVSVSSTGAQADNASTLPGISGDGRYVVYQSLATNLVPSDLNAASDIFVYDRVTGVTEIVSVSSDAVRADDDSYNAALSVDGRYVIFDSIASNLVAGDTRRCGEFFEAHNCSDIFIHDRVTRQTTRASLAHNGSEGDGDSSEPSFSADGRYITFLSRATNLVPAFDANNLTDIFWRDRGPQEPMPSPTATPPPPPTRTPGPALLFLTVLRR